MKNKIMKCLIASCALVTLNANAGILGLDLIETGDDAVIDISSVFSSSDVSVVAGSEVFSGSMGIGNAAQSAIFSGVNISNSSNSLNLNEGFLLTSGTANVPNVNTANETTVSNGVSGDVDLQALALANGLSPAINNVNFYSFDFTLAAQFNAITLDFLFGTEEFPTQSVTDILGIFVDGINYAFFSNGSLVNNNGNPANFNDNSFGSSDPYDIEYNGLSDILSVIGRVDSNLSQHTLKIAVADTTDTRYDSGLFVSNLGAIFSSGGGGIVPPTTVNTPATLSMLFLGGLLLIANNKRKNK